MLVLYIVLVVCIIIAVFVASDRLKAEVAERERIADVVVANVDFSGEPDGVYYGECRMQAVGARVRVTVKSGRVEAVELLEHDNQRGSKAEVIPAVIVANQTLEVDAVTGATLSSKVILKSTERALASARRSCLYEEPAAAEGEAG